MNLLLIEDNLSIVKGLVYALKANYKDVDYVTSISQAKEYIDTKKIDLIILDIALPDGNGFKLFKDYIRDKNIPVIFLSAIDNEDTIVNALDLGADDYITKPFSTKELMARVNRVLIKNKKGSRITVKDITFDMDKMTVYRKDVEIPLTTLELRILQILFLNINKVVTRDFLLDKVWEWTGNDVDSHTITVYLKRIREKLGVDIIKTVKGIGYRIDEE